MTIHGIYPEDVIATLPHTEKGRTICGRSAGDLETVQVNGFDDEYGLAGVTCRNCHRTWKTDYGLWIWKACRRSASSRREAGPSLLVAAAQAAADILGRIDETPEYKRERARLALVSALDDAQGRVAA